MLMTRRSGGSQAADGKLCAVELACRERHLVCARELLLAGAAPNQVATRPRRCAPPPGNPKPKYRPWCFV